MGHMSKVEQQSSAKTYYMGHHGVYRDDSLTTALRVVFDASMPSSTGYSLNNLQMVGPTIQEDLVSILIRFRRHNFVVSADIAKMYRCVLVAEEDRALQRILWRFNNDEHLNAYELNTVTYGMAAASFLAIHCIFQLADENQGIYPDIERIMKSDFYVDDLLTGADTVEGATRISEVIFKILKQGCFELRKFHSNEPKVLDWLETDNDNLSKMVDLGERKNSNELVSSVAQEGIDWRFIPPHSPHFGGLWEAGIKSMKHHLKRVIGGVSLTFENFYTLLVEVEAIMNSRPISPLSSSHHDLNPLTPSNFLLGRTSDCIPDPDLRPMAVNRLDVYQHLQQLKQHIWSRWNKEYVTELQQRCK
nr:unnamed protein product [Callosobruchus analis]